MQPMKTPDGKTYTDYHAYINALARLSGLTYGQYVARYDAPATAPAATKPAAPAPGESARCASAAVLSPNRQPKKYCSSMPQQGAYADRTQAALGPKKNEKEEHIESLHCPVAATHPTQRIAGIGETICLNPAGAGIPAAPKLPGRRPN